MPGGFPLGLDQCNANAVGAVTSGNSFGTVLTTSATANTQRRVCGAYGVVPGSMPVGR